MKYFYELLGHYLVGLLKYRALVPILLIIFGLFFFSTQKKEIPKAKILNTTKEELKSALILNFDTKVEDFEMRSKSFEEGFKIISKSSIPFPKHTVQLTKKDYLDTYIFSHNKNEKIPFFNYSKLNEYLKISENNFKNLLIVKVDNAFSMDLTNKYDQKLRLDSNFKISEKGEFYLFKDIEGDHAELKIDLANKIYKIPLYFMNNALSFYGLKANYLKNETINLKQINLLSKELSEVKEIYTVKNYFDSENFERKSLSTFWSESSVYFQNKMILLEKFIALYSKNDLNIPSIGFKQNILSEFKIDQYFRGCLIQMDSLSSKSKIKFNFYSNESDYFLTESLDVNGQFNPKFDPSYSKFYYIKTESTGMFNLSYEEEGVVYRVNAVCMPGHYFLVN